MIAATTPKKPATKSPRRPATSSAPALTSSRR
jgi:hypothetical protein